MKILEAFMSALVALFASPKQPRQPTRVVNIDLITKWEGLRLKAYQDTGGVWTIGYGHTKTAKPDMVITKDEAIRLKKEDLSWVEDVLNTTVTVPLKQHEYDALASLVFNIGGTQWANSTMLRKLNAGDYEGAADEFDRWVYDNGKRIQGLANRRADEANYFRNGKV